MEEVLIASTLYSVILYWYMVISLFSIIYAIRHLSRPGYSEDMRKFYLNKHMLYVVVFIIVWSLTLSSSYYTIYHINDMTERYENKRKDHENIPGFDSPEQISIMGSILTGLVMCLIRLNEPYFKFLCKKRISSFYGVPISERDFLAKGGECDDTYAAALSSSLNIELVFVILKSITESEPKSQAYHALDNTINQHKRVFLETREYDIDSKEIPAGYINSERDATLFQKQIERRLGEDMVGFIKQETQKSDKITINTEIKVTEIAPRVFKKVREMDDIHQYQIEQSLAVEKNKQQVFRAGESSGKSGSFFFFSHDRRFIIKTMNEEELKVFMKMFPGYLKHIS